MNVKRVRKAKELYGMVELSDTVVIGCQFELVSLKMVYCAVQTKKLKSTSLYYYLAALSNGQDRLPV